MFNHFPFLCTFKYKNNKIKKNERGVYRIKTEKQTKEKENVEKL